MDYTDFIKYLKQNMPDDKSLAYLAKIEKEHGKEAVIASVTGPMHRYIPPVPPMPQNPNNAFELLYYFPDKVHCPNNDLLYKEFTDADFLGYHSQVKYVNKTANASHLLDRDKKYFVYMVSITTDNFNPGDLFNVNFHIGPDHLATSNVGAFLYSPTITS